MGGRPVWLASISQWRNQRLVTTDRWGHGARLAALRVAQQVLGPVGDPTLERGFLMCSTLCFHRGATDTEIAVIPPGPGGLAGPPGVAVIYETPAVPPMALSFTPCDRRWFDTIRLPGVAMRIPVDDCGRCLSCLAREAIINRATSG